jgi:two-component system nitrate/nitrite response regulator NarL
MGHFNGLSDREMQILARLLNGAKNKQIAYELKISDGTVKVRLKAILKKIHVRNRTQAAIWALNHGLARDLSSSAQRVATIKVRDGLAADPDLTTLLDTGIRTDRSVAT